jgi:hypothetical protein
VHLVHDLLRGIGNASPPIVGPREVVRIDDLRRTERTVRLISRCRIRVEVAAEPLAVARSRGDAFDVCGVVPARLGLELHVALNRRFEDERHVFPRGRPHTKVDAAVGELGPDRESALHAHATAKLQCTCHGMLTLYRASDARTRTPSGLAHVIYTIVVV